MRWLVNSRWSARLWRSRARDPSSLCTNRIAVKRRCNGRPTACGGRNGSTSWLQRTRLDRCVTRSTTSRKCVGRATSSAVNCRYSTPFADRSRSAKGATSAAARGRSSTPVTVSSSSAVRCRSTDSPWRFKRSRRSPCLSLKWYCSALVLRWSAARVISRIEGSSTPCSANKPSAASSNAVRVSVTRSRRCARGLQPACVEPRRVESAGVRWGTGCRPPCARGAPVGRR